MSNIQKIKNYIQGNKQIFKWAVGSFLVVFLLAFFVYVGNEAKSGIYPEQEFGTLKDLQERLNPYVNIYNIKEQKDDNGEYINKVEKVGFGFISTDNNNRRGSLIVKVYSDSPSEKAGLQVGDVIVASDGVRILNDSHLGGLIDFKDKINLKINRENQILDISINKGSFMGEEGFRVGSSKLVPKSKDIPDGKVLDQVNYGFDKLKNGMQEYYVKGISILGALIIALLWALTILPIIILGTLFYKLISKIHHKVFIILINLISISVIMSGIMFLLSRNLFFDQMVRESANMGGGFIDLSGLIYPMFTVISSLFLIIGYTITLFIYKKSIYKNQIKVSKPNKHSEYFYISIDKWWQRTLLIILMYALFWCIFYGIWLLITASFGEYEYDVYGLPLFIGSFILHIVFPIGSFFIIPKFLKNTIQIKHPYIVHSIMVFFSMAVFIFFEMLIAIKQFFSSGFL